ncbi:MAG: isoaspartyl peptidase/L-asparaginase [Hyphomonadaceae bacterium]|nr:isoaspartyl peptidase/L-asparaginase [Hyphomonadaceae bacterium]
MSRVWSIAIHGGAGPIRQIDYGAAEAHMAETLKAASESLAAGGRAVTVAEQAVMALEESGHHIAGRGASPNALGQWELDAAIMDGETRNAGAVAALRGFRSPVRAARMVMLHSQHVMLVGKGASHFLRGRGLRRVWNPRDYYRPSVKRAVAPGELAHGTVGAVVLDGEGRLAAATSTGGLLGKMPGRVGDTPILGAGTWADERVAVSCTGQGEFFMRAAVAADVSARVRYGKMGVEQAAKAALDDVHFLGGDGGLIAVDVLGNVTTPFLSESMKRGIATSRGVFHVAVRR